MYKLRDGPIDWFFCDSDHALDWLDIRHCSAQASAYFHSDHEDRAAMRGDLSVDEYFADILAK